MEFDLNWSFWIGLAVAIPLSIAGNLATDPIKRWWSDRPGRKRASKIRILAARIRRAEEINRFGSVSAFGVYHILFVSFLIAGTMGAYISLDGAYASLRQTEAYKDSIMQIELIAGKGGAARFLILVLLAYIMLRCSRASQAILDYEKLGTLRDRFQRSAVAKAGP